MNLYWRRATYFCALLLGIVLAGRGWLLFPTQPALAIALFTLGVAIGVGTMVWHDSNRGAHTLLLILLGAASAASLFSRRLDLWSLGAAVGAALLTVSASLAWWLRDRPIVQTLTAYYAAAVASRRVRENPAQQEVVAVLDSLRGAFLIHERRRRLPWAGLLSRPKGIYLYGPAGQGKSFLLDGMYDTLDVTAKRRFHFHDLMNQLAVTMHKNAERSLPFRRTARALVPRGCLVMIDEVNVLDAGTAHLLTRLLQAWWGHGCVICISSNQSPQQLFKGVALEAKQLARFFEQLEKHTDVRKLHAGEDYRLQKLTASDLYQHPAGERADERLGEIVALLAETPPQAGPVEVNGRTIHAKAVATGVVWFDFVALCESPLGYRDYLRLVDTYPNVVLSDIPRMHQEDPARRFAWLVEIFYDRRRRLILSAAEPLDTLFAPGLSSHGRAVDFDKVRSRLAEMQSSEYDYSLV